MLFFQMLSIQVHISFQKDDPHFFPRALFQICSPKTQVLHMHMFEQILGFLMDLQQQTLYQR